MGFKVIARSGFVVVTVMRNGGCTSASSCARNKAVGYAAAVVGFTAWAWWDWHEGVLGLAHCWVLRQARRLGRACVVVCRCCCHERDCRMLLHWDFASLSGSVVGVMAAWTDG